MRLYINWFDLVILVFLGLLIWRGLKDGLATQLLVCAGFFGGLFIGGWLFPHLLPIHNQNLQVIVNANLVLLLAVCLAGAGYQLGRKLHLSIGKNWPHKLEKYSSIVFSLGVGLIAVWLVGSMVGRLPVVGLGNSANDSLIVQNLDLHLPPIPAVFAVFGRQIDPNSPPRVFIKTKTQVEAYIPINSPAIQAVATKAESSIVRITSFACGGIISGSGFVVAPDLVMTNAHVIAGAHRPIIKYGTQSYEGVPILFSQSMDVTILHVKGLPANPLTLLDREVADNTPVAVLGYPGGNYTALPGIVIDKQLIQSSNLYGVGAFGRQAYEVKANVAEGSSGGPMITENGKVVGVIFAKSIITENYGYALTSSSLQSLVHQAQTSTRRISTGTCISN